MNLSKIQHSYGRLFVHLMFWMVCIIWLTSINGVGMPSYTITLTAVLMLLPVHLIYFYTLRYLVIEKYLDSRRFLMLGFSFLLTSLFCLCLYRTIEILFSDPFLFNNIKKLKPDFWWSKLDGSFSEQFFNLRYMMHALEQSNTVVWICLMISFFKMWYERKQAALQAELNFLKGQIHPHFLFNTLNNLYAHTLSQSPKSPVIVLGLSNILRYMLYECNSDLVPLKRDIEILKSYITLEKIRYEERLDLNLVIKGQIGHQQIIPLLMLPLVENAFKHGASEMVQDAWINVDLEVSEHRLKFKVSNSKPSEPVSSSKSHFGKIGLTNVRSRLELLYKNAHSFTTYDEGDMFVAILEVNLKSSNR